MEEGIWPSIRRLFGYLKPYRTPIAVGLSLAILSSILSVIGPQYLSKMTDTVFASVGTGIPMDMETIGSIGIILLIIYSVATIATVLETYILSSCSERIASGIRHDIVNKIDQLPIRYFDRSSTGDLMSRLTNDADTVGMSTDSIDSIIVALIMIIGSLSMMLITDWRLAIVSVLPSLAGLFLIHGIVKKSRKYFVSQIKDLGAINSLVDECYTGHDEMVLFNALPETRRRFDEINSKLFVSSWKSRFLSSSLPQIMNLIGNLGYVAVCVVGSYFIIEGSINYGIIVAFIVYVNQFSRPIVTVANTYASLQSIAVSSDRIFEILDEEEMDDENDLEPLDHPLEGHVEFCKVRFSYVSGTEVIKGLDLDVQPGQKVAIVGPTGSGKSTIAGLLLRFYDPDSGHILIDGRPIVSVRKSDLRRSFAVVPQTPFVFSGTLKENVAFGMEGVTEDDVIEACREVGLESFLEGLPEGIMTHVDDMSSLSAGQRQQIVLARARCRKASILILDEATSSVDTCTEKVIQDSMDRAMSGRTSFVIAHRLSTIMTADRILVVKDGNVIEQGTHDELLAKGGLYTNLFNSQFEGCD